MSNTTRTGARGATVPGAQGVTDPLASLEATARDLEARVHALTEQLCLARGTRDIVPPPPAEEPTEAPLADRLEATLRAAPSSIEDLAAALHAPTGRITAALRPLRKRLWNAGTDVAPKWFLPPGPDASPEEFLAAVRALISLQPHSTAELQRATGTVGKRVWHALVKLGDADGSRLVRYGDPRRPKWFWLPEGMDLSKFTGR